MSYFNKYYLEFEDAHAVNPILYRIDILDSVGATPSEPFKLQGATPTLITKRINENDDKRIGIIGREITISYIYNGNADEPVPDDFFDSDERRFRVEVRLNNVLDGVYYIKGDFSSAPYDAPPYAVQLKAVDGLSYGKSVKFNIENGSLLLYDRINLYEAVMSRALLQIMDTDTKLNVLNTLYPTNIPAGLKLFFNCYVHTDNFFDFVDGPKSVYDVINIIAITFRCKVFIEENIVWFLRIQDLTLTTFNIDQYSTPDTAETVVIDMIAGTGPGYSYDAIPITGGKRSSTAGFKKVQYKADYRAINRLVNFDWRSIVGDSFEFWASDVVGLARHGTGTVGDPYKAFLPYDFSNPGTTHIQQEVPFVQTIPPTLIGPAFVGDRLELQIPWNMINVGTFKIRLRIQSNNPGSVHYLSSGGSWVPGVSTFIEISRSGKKQKGAYNIITDAIPENSFGTINYTVELEIYSPTALKEYEGAAPAGVEIYPIKLGINNSSSKSLITQVENVANFSAIKDEEIFNLFDNGDIFSANVLTVTPFGEHVPVDNWDSDKLNVQPADIEYHMSRSYIDQYSKSIRTWQGDLFSNTLKYYQLIELVHIPDKRFMQISDTFDNEKCTHNIYLIEVLEEGNANIVYNEYDIEDAKD